jgi:2-succinyl-5-enolpyruvyl-6-hydroxy-3-cyclohexene-1-carboxylate synthase
MSTGADVTATFCATLVDEWVRCGVTDAVVCPGSRSTPLALAVAADARLRLHVHHDERSGGFVALGLGLATGRPAVVVTTSGTAAVELHAAVVEAHQAEVPMIVATADRPPELQGVGAPQTIDQTELYGGSVRWFVEPGVPDDAAATAWRQLAGRSVAASSGSTPGPVHLNLAFREPLVGTAGVLPPADGSPDIVAAPPGGPSLAGVLAGLAPGTRGVLVAGGGIVRPELVHELADRVGWPVLADPRSGAHRGAPAAAGRRAAG